MIPILDMLVLAMFFLTIFSLFGKPLVMQAVKHIHVLTVFVSELSGYFLFSGVENDEVALTPKSMC